MPVGRYAPSPTGDLHVGNLRTALLAWLFAAKTSSPLRLRIDDLDPAARNTTHEATQLSDLAALGIVFDGKPLRQSARLDRYDAVIVELENQSLTYPCFCSRREIRESVSAEHEHLPEGAYPGTCRHLSTAEREIRARSRPAATRVDADHVVVTFIDDVYGPTSTTVDDFVIRRNDGTPAYNLASVVDDEEQRVGQVVRGADLLDGTARQVWLRTVLGLAAVEHAHVPLMVSADGTRLAKRDGAVTLGELAAMGWTPLEVRSILAAGIGLAEAGESPTLEVLVDRFDPDRLPLEPTVWHPPDQNASSDTV